MDTDPIKSSKRVLEPHERISEVLFGLIMVLTFTGSLSVATAERGDVKTMLIGALGCNLAWGLIDGIFYLMACLADKGRSLLTYRAVRAETDAKRAERLMLDAMPSPLAAVLQDKELAEMHQRLKALPEPPERASLSGSDWRGAIGVFLLVFLSTLPVALPFLFFTDLFWAKRISNGVAIVMLFLTGYAYGRGIGRAPGFIGIAMVLLGATLVAITIALGG